MTFPLGSLQADGPAPSLETPPRKSRKSAQAAAAAAAAPERASTPSLPHPWGLVATGIAWVLVVLAFATHNPHDPAFSTSGLGPEVANKAGAFGAWLSDLSLFLVGLSAWWLPLIGARLWLGSLARLLRALRGEAVDARQAWTLLAYGHRGLPWWRVGVGTLVLLCASSALEWSRLYHWEHLVPGGHAGGVVGVSLGTFSGQLLGFTGSGLIWIAALLFGLSWAFGFSWARVAERLGSWLTMQREHRLERRERAEDLFAWASRPCASAKRRSRWTARNRWTTFRWSSSHR